MNTSGKTKFDLGAVLLLSIMLFGAGLAAQPLAPTTLFVDSVDAQAGTQGDPVTGISRKPLFSAIFNHSNTPGVVEAARIQMATDSAFSNIVATTGWQTVTATGPGVRITDVAYNGNGLASNTRYWWRIRMRNAASQVGPWSTEAASFETVPFPKEATTLFVGSAGAQSGTQGDPVMDVSLQGYFSAVVDHDSATEQVTDGKIQFAYDDAFANVIGASGWLGVTPVSFPRFLVRRYVSRPRCP